MTAFQSNLAALAFSENERPLSLQAGSYRIQGLEPGSYLLAVRDARGAAYLEEELLLEDSIELERTVEFVEVEGRVTRGDPVKGAVWWGGERGGILGWSDEEEGAYRVLLPANRKVWLVEVLAEEQTVGKCGVVPLPRTDNRGRRIRNFELGSGVLEVRCRKAEGEGIRGCFVVLLVDRVSRFSRADHSGRARFEGLREGVFYVQGSAAGRSSCLLRKEFPEGETSERVELKLNPLQTLAGWVGASGQPLSGVSMGWTAYAHSGNVVGFGQATSDAAENFSLELCSEAAVVQVVAFPPGRSLMVRRIPVTPGGFLLIESPEGRASLELLGADVEQPSLPPWWIELPGGGQVAGLSAIQRA